MWAMTVAMILLHLLSQSCAHNAAKRQVSCLHPKLFQTSLSLLYSDLLPLITEWLRLLWKLACLKKPAEKLQCQLLTHWKYGRSHVYITLTTTILSPHAVICCSYFITVLLDVIGLKAAKQHIMNCKKWKAVGCIYCFMGSHAAALEVTQNVKTFSCPVADYISDLRIKLLRKPQRWWCPVQQLHTFFPLVILTECREMVLNIAWRRMCSELHIIYEAVISTQCEKRIHACYRSQISLRMHQDKHGCGNTRQSVLCLKKARRQIAGWAKKWEHAAQSVNHQSHRHTRTHAHTEM